MTQPNRPNKNRKQKNSRNSKKKGPKSQTRQKSKPDKRRENPAFEFWVRLGQTLTINAVSMIRRLFLAIKLEEEFETRAPYWKAHRRNNRHRVLRRFNDQLHVIVDIDTLRNFLENDIESAMVENLTLKEPRNEAGELSGEVKVTVTVDDGLKPIVRTFKRKFLKKAVHAFDRARSYAQFAETIFGKDEERAELTTNIVERALDHEFASPTTTKEDIDRLFNAATDVKVPEVIRKPRPQKATAGGAKLGDLTSFQGVKAASKAEERRAKSEKAAAKKARKREMDDEEQRATKDEEQARRELIEMEAVTPEAETEAVPAHVDTEDTAPQAVADEDIVEVTDDTDADEETAPEEPVLKPNMVKFYARQLKSGGDPNSIPVDYLQAAADKAGIKLPEAENTSDEASPTEAAEA